MKKSAILLVAVCLALIASAQDKAPQQVITTFSTAHPFDAVWPAVVETFSDLNLPIDKVEKDSGLITTDWIGLNDIPKEEAKSYMNCDYPRGIFAKTTRRVRFNIFIKKIGDESQLKINCQFEFIAHYTGPGGPKTYKCTSTGVFEKKIFNAVADKLK